MPHHISTIEKYELFESVIASWLHYMPNKALAIHIHSSMAAMVCSTHLHVFFHKPQSHNEGGLNDSEEEMTTKRSECVEMIIGFNGQSLKKRTQ